MVVILEKRLVIEFWEFVDGDSGICFYSGLFIWLLIGGFRFL